MSKTVRQTPLGLYGVFVSPLTTLANASWVHLADNLEGSVSLAQEDNEETEIFVEETDTPIVKNVKAGVRTFNSSIPDLSFGVLQKLFNATAEPAVENGEDVTRVAMPDSAQFIYWMFKFVPKEGPKQFIFTKGQVSAKVNGNMSKTETVNVDLVVTALQPDTGENGFYIDLPKGENPGYLLGDPVVADAVDNLAAAGNTCGLELTVDAGSAQDVNDLDFTAATEWSEVITELNSKFTGATFSYDDEEGRLLVTSDTTGVNSSIALADGSTGAAIRGATMLNTSAAAPVQGS